MGDTEDDDQSNLTIAEKYKYRGDQLFEELSNHCEMKTIGFKFIFVQEEQCTAPWHPPSYQVTCIPPEGGLYITDNPFTCNVVNNKPWYEKGKDDLVIELSLQATDDKYYDGSLVPMGTEYMGYCTRTFKTNKEVVEQFEKIIASKK